MIDFSKVITAEQKAAAAQAAFAASVQAAVDDHVEATARKRGYNSAAYCASYVTSTIDSWATEAQTFIAWRDDVWMTIITGVKQGTMPESIEEVINQLPKIDW